MRVLPADELEEWLSERLESFVDEVGDYSIVLACAFSRRVGSGLPASDLVTAIRELDPGPRRVMLLWGAGTTEVADPLEAVRAAGDLRGCGDEAWIGVHPTRPFHGKFLRVLPEGEGPELSIAFSWNLSRTAADAGSLESVLERREERGEPFGEFVSRLREDGWLVGRLRPREGGLGVTFDGVRRFRFPCSDARDARIRGRVGVLSGTVSVSGVVLDDGTREVELVLDRELRESVDGVETVVTEVVTEEFRRVVREEGLGNDVVRYGMERVIRDVVEELVDREVTTYEVAVRVRECVVGDETGVLADERRFPDVKAALHALVRDIVKERLKDLSESSHGRTGGGAGGR
ncbi:hypothetical protein [Methanopyrus kandleri]